MNGIDCFFEGSRLVRQPGLRRYVIIPLLINITVLTVVLSYGFSQYDIWLAAITNWLPDWLAFLSWIMGVLSAIIIFTLTIYSFSMIANIIASPFNALLSQKVEELLVPNKKWPEINPFVVMGRAVKRELVKLLYFLPRLLGLLVLTVIPGLNVIAPFAWILFSGWMMAVQYTDYGADNNEVSFSELRRRLRANLVQAILFGVLVYFVTAIPLLNLILIPIAVAGGTVYWIEWLRVADAQSKAAQIS